MRRITKATSCVLFVSLVLVGLGETESLVLCIGFDGHISLEDTRTGICNHTLAKVAEELGLPTSDELVHKNAKCCPCADMNLPGQSLDYPEVMPVEILCVPEPAEFSLPVFELTRAEFVYVPSSEIIPHPPPPDPGDNAARIALRSVVILV
ncbi:MAG: hypothetical protein QGH60_08120 [Phycisphaerae bacterium]|jgi:hypothetical protein|nr:hypothetical protein [Phycisphaerae bacterium]